MKPHACVLLAIDPGASSGWALFDHGRYVASGIAMRSEQRSEVVRGLLTLAGGSLARVVVVREDWTVGGGKGKGKKGTRWNVATILGMGAGWGRWAEQLELADMAARRIVKVEPATWRKVLKGIGPIRARDDAKRTAQRFARAKLKLPADARIEADQAEAIAIGFWAVTAEEVGAVLPKRAAKLSLVGGAA